MSFIDACIDRLDVQVPGFTQEVPGVIAASTGLMSCLGDLVKWYLYG